MIHYVAGRCNIHGKETGIRTEYNGTEVSEKLSERSEASVKDIAESNEVVTATGEP